MAPQADAGQECRGGPVDDIFGCVNFFEMDPQHLPRLKVYGAIARIHTRVEPDSAQAVVQAEKRQQTVG